jgi:hypothetical protein
MFHLLQAQACLAGSAAYRPSTAATEDGLNADFVRHTAVKGGFPLTKNHSRMASLGDGMADLSKRKQRITLAQLTLDLQKPAVDQTEAQESELHACCGDRSMNAIASHVALGIAKHRTGQ